MVEPLTLDFTAPPMQGRYRSTDPETSKKAARKVKAQHQYELVLKTLYEADTALTDDEIAERAGLLRHSAGTRRGVAVKEGHVTRAGTGKSALGNNAATWVLTDEGKRVASTLRSAA